MNHRHNVHLKRKKKRPETTCCFSSPLLDLQASRKETRLSSFFISTIIANESAKPQVAVSYYITKACTRTSGLFFQQIT